MTPATYVTINDAVTYKLGAVLQKEGTWFQIQCIAIEDGPARVVRVCTWQNGWGMGTRVRTSGESLYFHRNGWADND